MRTSLHREALQKKAVFTQMHDFCGYRDLLLPDGNRVSAFSVASTAIAAAQWSSTQVWFGGCCS